MANRTLAQQLARAAAFSDKHAPALAEHVANLKVQAISGPASWHSGVWCPLLRARSHTRATTTLAQLAEHACPVCVDRHPHAITFHDHDEGMQVRLWLYLINLMPGNGTVRTEKGKLERTATWERLAREAARAAADTPTALWRGAFTALADQAAAAEKPDMRHVAPATLAERAGLNPDQHDSTSCILLTSEPPTSRVAKTLAVTAGQVTLYQLPLWAAGLVVRELRFKDARLEMTVTNTDNIDIHQLADLARNGQQPLTALIELSRRL